MLTLSRLAVLVSLLAFTTPLARAQEPAAPPAPAPPPPVWTGSFGAGLTLTRGNVDATTVNLSFDTKYAPKGPFLFKADGLYLRSRSDGNDIANRLALQGRLERSLGRAFVFGQLQYLRDPFKAIDYLVSPTGGVGYRIVDTPALQLAADTSVGVVWEKDPGTVLKTSPAWAAGEKLSYKLTATATVTQSVQALWKLDDFGDSLYTFGAGLASAVSRRSQLKVDLLDTYKSAPAAGTQSNDVALLLSLVFKY